MTTVATCPAWCDEHHDHREAMYRSADHARSFLHEAGGAYVGLHRLDLDDTPGESRVVVDVGPDRELDVEHARRLALAILTACDQV